MMATPLTAPMPRTTFGVTRPRNPAPRPATTHRHAWYPPILVEILLVALLNRLNIADEAVAPVAVA